MKNWLLKNEKTIIASAFIIPIFIVAIVSISHVTQWYGLTNPLSWAIYLSIGVEIAAMSALAAITARMGRNAYFPFIFVTLIQFIGNVFFSYSFIDVTTASFKNWVELASPIVGLFGIDSTDIIGHKRFLALFSGGMLPIISLSFLHMLVKYTEKISNEKKIDDNPQVSENINNEESVIIESNIESKNEIQVNEPEPINEVMFVNLNDMSDVIEPKVDEVIIEEPIVQPEVFNEVIEDIIPEVKEQTREEFLEEIYGEIRNEEKEKEVIDDEPIVEEIPEVIDDEPIVEEIPEVIDDEPIVEEEDKFGIILDKVKNFPKIKRHKPDGTPPDIKWGT